MNTSSYTLKISKYNNLNTEISKISTNLDLAVSALNNVLEAMETEYSINSRETNLYYKTKELKGSISKTSSYLTNNITNSINSEISALKKEMKEINI